MLPLQKRTPECGCLGSDDSLSIRRSFSCVIRAQDPSPRSVLHGWQDAEMLGNTCPDLISLSPEDKTLCVSPTAALPSGSKIH